MKKSDIHPDIVLEKILAQKPRSNKARNLRLLHGICQRQFDQTDVSVRDFSIPAIGRLCEAQGLFRWRVLYNAPSADYVALISAWAAYAGPSARKAPKEPDAPLHYEYLKRIEDPALRQIMQLALAERDKLKAQINLLKSQTQIVIDKRPLGTEALTTPGSMPVLMPKAQLTGSERTALENAISEKYLERVGLCIGLRGEIERGDGRRVFEVGFVDAIKKILGGS